MHAEQQPEQAWRLLQQGKTTRAQALCRRVAGKLPAHSGARHLLGLALKAAGDLGRGDEAESSYGRALELDPASKPALIGIVRARRMSGAWSVRLRRDGFHVNHVHPEGWISSACYVSVPAEVKDETRMSGWLKFGEPRHPVPRAGAERHVQPRAGRLVLFPSYMWHGTTPILGDEPRMTIAFDAIPSPGT